jgi:ABC-type transport system substrate-binding protein
MLLSLGSGYHIPEYYFANLDVRRAWAYTFNYTNYINNLLGNSIYGADFGFHYTGIIPLGMSGYLNATQLQQAGANVPIYDLTMAKQYLEESGLYNTSINIPILVYAGDPTDYAAAEDWGSVLNSIDPNIHASALYIDIDMLIGYMVPGENPMPVYLLDWGPDFPFASDYVVPMYQEDGFAGIADGSGILSY